MSTEIENQMVVHDGYGIKDAQQSKHEGIDACGEEITTGDEIIVHEGELILASNAANYLVEVLGAERKIAGEENEK